MLAEKSVCITGTILVRLSFFLRKGRIILKNPSTINGMINLYSFARPPIRAIVVVIIYTVLPRPIKVAVQLFG